ncbi:MAG TPA: hypothetical protein VM555_11675, partial [Tahibacter sp.]|nr:hypothetical protein [Tahibacter sp.]
MRPLTSVALAFLATALYCVAMGRERIGRLLALPVCLYAVAVLVADLGGPGNAWAENRLVSLPNSALALSLGGIGVAVWPSRRESRLRSAITWTCGVMSV